MAQTEGLSDDELVLRARKGDRDAYRVLVEKYQARAYGIAYEILRSREDAEDVVQESFVKGYLSLQNFRGQSAFYTWMYRIVYNMAIDLKRKVTRQGGAPVEFNETSASALNADGSAFMGRVDGPQAALLRKEQARRIHEALDQISEEHRAVIVLREVDGLSYEEIAKIVGVTKGTVMSRLHYARKRMQSLLSDIVDGVVKSSESEFDKDGLDQDKKRGIAYEN